MIEKIVQWIVWKLPRRIVYWSAIRLMAHATTSDYANTEVSSLNVIEALKRW